MQHTFPKRLRLKNFKIIKQLFTSGESEFQFPFKVLFLRVQEPLDSAQSPEILISVSKRNFKRAVHRNRIKRLTREAYRKNYSAFQLTHLQAVALIYIDKQLPNMPQIEKAVMSLLSKLELK